jgi:hypothetical protein
MLYLTSLHNFVSWSDSDKVSQVASFSVVAETTSLESTICSNLVAKSLVIQVLGTRAARLCGLSLAVHLNELKVHVAT